MSLIGHGHVVVQENCNLKNKYDTAAIIMALTGGILMGVLSYERYGMNWRILPAIIMVIIAIYLWYRQRDLL